MKRKDAKASYQYTECGLNTVYLMSGFDFEDGGKTVVIKDIDGLHRAIGNALVDRPQRLSGEEFRFLRSELLLSQQSLAKILGVKELTINRWERGKTEIPLSTDAALRTMFRESNDEKSNMRETLENIADLDDELDRHLISLGSKQGKWVVLQERKVA